MIVASLSVLENATKMFLTLLLKKSRFVMKYKYRKLTQEPQSPWEAPVKPCSQRVSSDTFCDLTWFSPYCRSGSNVFSELFRRICLFPTYDITFMMWHIATQTWSSYYWNSWASYS